MTEQERFEAFIGGRTLYPANFTKVQDQPILGWNGAKPTDYVDPEIQKHWNTWQAAQQKEGCVLVPVEPNIHMIGAGMGGFVFPLDGGSFSKGEMVQAYKAMIAAAQEPT